MKSTELLPWDSEFFGFGVASLGGAALDRDELRKALDGLRRDGVVLVYWAPPADEPDSKRAGLAEHGRLVDRKTTYALDLDPGDPRPEPDPAVTPYAGRESTPELERLAIQSGHLSRFAVDPRIGHDRFEALYRRWLRNSLAGDFASAVLVATRDGRIVGLVTLAEIGVEKEAETGAHGSIGLIAVDSSARGLGLGSALVRSACDWCRDRGLPQIRVVTQGDNLAACRLYEKHGFERISVRNFFHFWL